jgi:hypothetical protein
LKRAVRCVVVLLVVAISAIVGTGSPFAQAQQPWQLTPAGWAKGEIEHLGTLPFETGTAVGGVVHEDHLYVSTWRSFSIYDVSDPTSPQRLSTTPLPVQVINEGPATNGEVLLLADDLDRVLRIWDVRDKRAPVLAAELPHQNPDHIWACVLDCTYAYGSGGTIVELTDPTAPEIVGNWRAIAPFRARHGIAEAEPGVVFVGSLPQYVLDARQDPANPTVVVQVEPPTTRFLLGESPVSYLQWPRGRFALTTLETPFSGPCTESSGGLVTYDTEGFEGTGTFAIADVFRITQSGLPSEGKVLANAVGCSALGLDAHPRFQTSRTVAVGWAENGVRIFTVSRNDGSIVETAGFIAHGTEAFAPVWASEDILYVVDTARGVDMFHVDAP